MTTAKLFQYAFVQSHPVIFWLKAFVIKVPHHLHLYSLPYKTGFHRATVTATSLEFILEKIRLN